MFGKLKEKLKNALSVFSNKAAEEATSLESPIISETISEKKQEQLAEKAAVDAEKKSNKTAKATAAKKLTAIGKDQAQISEDSETKDNRKSKSKEKQQPSATVNKAISTAAEINTQLEPALPAVNKESSDEKKDGFLGRFKGLFQGQVKETPTALDKANEKIPLDSEGKKGFFSKVKETITTRKISEEKFEQLFWDLELVLLENNVSVEVIEKIKIDLKRELVEKPLPRKVELKIEDTLRSTLEQILTHEPMDLISEIKAKSGPYIIAFFGINGAGKTTSIAKLAHYLKKNKLTVVLAACDTFRAAAIQQLQEHAEKLQVPIIKQDYGSDAAAIAFDAVKYAEKNGIKVVLIDTAGRLHSNTNLMAELQKIIRVAKPDLKLFVGESITGNDCIEQARKFNELVQVDGAILTKADVDDKGGAPLSISYTIGKPILFLGVGQGYDDLEEFNKDKILKQLF